MTSMESRQPDPGSLPVRAGRLHAPLVLLPIVLLVVVGCEGRRNVDDLVHDNAMVYYAEAAPVSLVPNVYALPGETSDEIEVSKHLGELVFSGLVQKAGPDEHGDEQLEWDLVQPEVAGADGFQYGGEGIGLGDRRHITIYLRRDVSWHNGERLNAGDVEYTFDALMEGDSPLSGWLNAFIKDVKQSGSSQVQFEMRMDTSREFFKEVVSPVKILPRRIQYEGQWRNMPQDLNDGSELSHTFRSQPVGTGPYKFDYVHEPTGAIVFERHDDYHFDGPEICRIIVQPESDSTQRARAYDDGPAGIVAHLGPEERELLSGQNRTVEYEPYSFSMLALNQRQSPFSNREVRRVIAESIDREALLESFQSGGRSHGGANESVFPSHSRYVADAPGAFETRHTDRSGAPAVFDADYATDGPLQLLVSEALFGANAVAGFVEELERQLAPAGLDLSLENEDAAGYWARLEDGAFDLALTHFSGFDYFFDILQILRSDGRLNLQGVEDPELDRLLTRFGETVWWEDTERGPGLKTLSRRIHERVDQRVHGIPLFSEARTSVFSNRLDGVEIHPEVLFADVNRWSLR